MRRVAYGDRVDIQVKESMEVSEDSEDSENREHCEEVEEVESSDEGDPIEDGGDGAEVAGDGQSNSNRSSLMIPPLGIVPKSVCCAGVR